MKQSTLTLFLSESLPARVLAFDEVVLIHNLDRILKQLP